ncbi:hypothetical protein [Actinomadura rugatobispora]|uniref:Uncharacterized protein n=1 Tax=Actinomadura rugatobispora TaxID=1994 RepID=A0ABW1A781_9ACTN
MSGAFAGCGTPVRRSLTGFRDVRRLKELGLTESLPTGYRLSPRGRAVLAHLETPGPDEV